MRNVFYARVFSLFERRRVMEDGRTNKLTGRDMDALTKGVKAIVSNPRGFREVVQDLLMNEPPQPLEEVKNSAFCTLVKELSVQLEKVFGVQMDRLLARAQESLDAANGVFPHLEVRVPDDLDRLRAIVRSFNEVRPCFGSGALASLLSDEINLEHERIERERVRASRLNGPVGGSRY